MITTDKVTEMFCILDEFCKNLDADGTFLSECLSRTGVKIIIIRQNNGFLSVFLFQ